MATTKTARTRRSTATPTIQPIDRTEETALVEQIIANKSEAEATPEPAPAREWGPYFTEAEANLILSTMRDTDVAAPFSKRWRFLLPLADNEAAALRQALNDHSISYREGLDLKSSVAAAKVLAGAVVRAQVGCGLTGVEVQL
jgi:hypothetical protein